jgi:hypothetical protein
VNFRLISFPVQPPSRFQDSEQRCQLNSDASSLRFDMTAYTFDGYDVKHLDRRYSDGSSLRLM